MNKQTVAAVLALSALALGIWGFSKAQEGLSSLQGQQTSELEATINGGK